MSAVGRITSGNAVAGLGIERGVAKPQCSGCKQVAIFPVAVAALPRFAPDMAGCQNHGPLWVP